MGWKKREIDKLEMLHFLGLVYAKTAVGFKKFGLQTLIETSAKPTVAAKCRPITKAILESGILSKEGYGSSLAYRWNLKEVGVPSLPMASMLIEKTVHVMRREKKEVRLRRACNN